MKSPRKWRSIGAAVVLAVAVPTLISSAGSAAQDEGLDNNSRSGDWVGSWATAVTAGEPTGISHDGFNNATVRMFVHLSVGGDKFRVRLSNVFGEQSVVVGHATIARPDTSTPSLIDLDPASVHNLTFNGQTSATMQKGDELLSDPVNMPVHDGDDLAVNVFLPSPTGPTTWHATSRQTSFSGPGDLTTSTAGGSASGFTLSRDCCWFFLSGVDVQRNHSAGSIVVLADS